MGEYKIARLSLLLGILFLASPFLLLAQLNGGCVNSGNQQITAGNIPDTISATAASSGTCGSYSYQWQISTDNVYFSDIPGATSQNLVYNTPLTQTSYFQRNTTCGNEVAFTTSITVTVIYYNTQQSGNFQRNNCDSGGTGSTVVYTVRADSFSSNVSQAAADQMAIDAVNVNGQTNANEKGTCTWYSARIFGYYYSSVCEEGFVPEPYLIDYPAGEFSSNISQAHADSLAQSAAQSEANELGTCIESCCEPPVPMGYKCIEESCEEGIKVYTDCYVGENDVIYRVFHYEFSDKSWSDDYYEISEVSCEE